MHKPRLRCSNALRGKIEECGMDSSEQRQREERVALALNGGRVTRTFRNALFDEAARRGVSVNELVLQCAAERLHERGAQFSGVFSPGDLSRVVEAA
jgi:predicted HicB family RNase H-like nuclease